MKPLNFPKFNLSITEMEGKLFVKDIFRNKRVRLTPEEWVRQHLVHFLVENLEYPRGLIKVESNVMYNQLEQRTDIVVYNKDASVYLVAECKRPEVKITQEALYQAVRYNAELNASFIIITNGNDHRCFRVNRNTGKIEILEAFPEYHQNK